ncbi:hypothetical protein KL918_005008 [Ogataea parapolymorpha]|uniref:Small glutamine-rich tetratricopeptide repeat-containing protein 2 n=1 Tax=Ogataea parapolymorpha (strain ATCC 26012 / BCRC 20466 / JCM 22074 / NRRL Y-7560 / DL-1) TaxID=871575 RepID=W1QJA5_OGAPD|nr:Small glutamine-rich tetratricopeptide repeat-containing protein 2 [Ogataea parapolymorpha DL-1]ESX01958.1 Small glutamine-rich tetratricopeptide repeat-containing protein 2 [Ogataea parapolymorpha DL-1]KAG7864882.1 hypothetical protein KL918_005008 [Ogataea parapolymorpha]KAG7871616.1 hypothetical protein KL916_003967 [Ogataea parapolymorpha]
MGTTDKQISALIVTFLRQCLECNTIPDDNRDSIEFAIESIGEAFGLDSSFCEQVNDVFGGQDLRSLISLPMKEASKSAEDESVPVHIHENEVNNKDKAESLKLEGNRAMAARNFKEAIEKYSAALDLYPSNAVYLSNRAAAYSSFGKHDLALKDAQKATESAPNYAKAWSRMGLAKYALGDIEGSMKAYERGLEVEGDSPSDAMKKGFETAKKKYTETLVASLGSANRDSESQDAASGEAHTMPDISNLASLFGGSSEGSPSGGNNLGGIAGLMNNPQIMQAAQRMMQNPEAMNGLLNNPQIRQMAQNLGLGGEGGLDELMNNPMLQNLANQFRNSS